MSDPFDALAAQLEAEGLVLDDGILSTNTVASDVTVADIAAAIIREIRTNNGWASVTVSGRVFNVETPINVRTNARSLAVMFRRVAADLGLTP